MRWVFLAPAIPGLLVDAQSSPVSQNATPAELQITILDSATHQPVACTVAIVDSLGRTAMDSEGFRNGFRSTGVSRRLLPPGPTQITVTRGLEFKRVEKQIVLRSGEVDRIELELERQVDLRRRGWFAGDSHVHMIHGEKTVAVDFDQVALSARAEDLQYLSLGRIWALANPSPERLESELSRRSTPDCLLTWNLEAPKNYFKGDAGRCLGHCWTLGMRGRTPEGADVIAALIDASAADYESAKPSFANFESHALIRAQGGSVYYTHPARWWTGSWGGAGGYPKRDHMRVSNLAVELPLDVLIGPTFDGLDVITGANEFGADEKSFQLWALLLNHGYRVAATASSDSCFDRPAGAVPGAARLYTYLEGGYSLPAVARATAQGRTFATTGPLVLASVEGQPPGSAFAANGNACRLHIETWASGTVTNGLSRVELFRNGQSKQRFLLESHPPCFQTNLSIAERENAWYCVRVFGADERRQRAVSGAFFFDVNPWQPPEPVPARIMVRVEDAGSGHTIAATLTEVNYLGTRPQTGKSHALPGGSGHLILPATSRLRAEVDGFAPLTLSPLFDHPALRETLTKLEDKDLVNWATYETIRKLLGEIDLTFKLTKAHPP